MTAASTAADIDEYIAGFPEDTRKILEKIRRTIREAAPDAVESISYRIPTYKLNGRRLVYFAGHKNHIGVYPVPIGNPELEQELAPYASGQGTAKFPLDRPIPFDLVERIVKLGVEENTDRGKR